MKSMEDFLGNMSTASNFSEFEKWFDSLSPEEQREYWEEYEADGAIAEAKSF